ncbi:hypothetical protein BSKO_00381 [Bryopsis sp. KO-2023]|nr:hypothetical protein BSKO_00381 [Bryopsis sp. KO-2023]
MANVAEWFRAVDHDGDGQITAQELQAALRRGNLNFSLATVARMIRAYDTNQNGMIDSTEFLGLHEFLMTMQKSFSYFDRNREGQLTFEQVMQAIMHAGIQLDETAFYSMARAFDPDRDGKLGLPEFIALSLFLKSAKAAFQAFDPHQAGNITLNFNQFIFACSHVA